MLQQLTRRLHQLALQGTKSNGTIQICTRYLQTSSVCQRSLDTRRLPIYRFPSNKKGRWEPRKKFTEMYEYTVEPLPFPRTGGRGPNGRIWNHRRGGGDKKVFRMIAWARGGSADAKKPEVEVVSEVRSDQNRTGNIAMVATGERKRWILATENMKPGDVLKNSMHLAETPVRGKEGDTYPLGSLPVGSLVNCVEQFPGHGGFYARAAGTSAMLLKKVGDKCIVRLPSKREVQVSAMCQATLGRVSNIDHNKQIKGKAGVNRWLGIRPRSGRWHRKTGRQGRKIRPIKPMLTCDKPRPPKNERIYTKPIDGVRLLPRLLPGDFQI